ncbi:MAG: hypothetical protein WD226_05805 [Planctomycetota bacterium]
MGTLGGLARSKYVAHRFALLVWDMNRDQISRAQEVRQALGAETIRPDSVSAPARDLRRGDDGALDAFRRESSLQAVAGRAGFVAALEFGSRSKPIQAFEELAEVVRDPDEELGLAAALAGDRDRDRLGVNIEADELDRLAHGSGS